MIGQDKLLYVISGKLGDMLRIISGQADIKSSESEIGGTESSADRLTSEVYNHRFGWIT